jgi:iron only hydrogenase large subunit-like protein
MNANERKMKMFGEMVKLVFNNLLKDKIDDIPYSFASGPGGITAAKNDALTAMGLDPAANADTELSHEVDAALNLEQVELPLVVVNRSICDECSRGDGRECANPCIYEHSYDRDCYTDDRGDGRSGAGCEARRESRPAGENSGHDNGSATARAPDPPIIENGKCQSCGRCISRCRLGAINDKIEFIPMSKYLGSGIPVYAAVAPAIAGQYGRNVSMGKLRSALKSIGFADMVEVALFADMVTLKEADEFSRLVNTEKDFLITSCCCPIWVNLLTRHFGKLYDRLTKTVSPMIAAGRIIKTLFPGCKTVFIGPCVAKKAEAKQPDLAGAIDYVLTFNELDQVFQALGIDLSRMPDDNKEQSSLGGRTYARTGGVSRAVEITLDRIAPRRSVKFKAIQADGVAECKKLLESIKEGRIEANFIEGMGCEGGCVGGPKRNREVAEGTECVEEYGRQASFTNPIDNINVKQLLKFLESMEKEQFDRLLLR